MTPNRLLDIAIEQFGRLGFDGASTREIARASGTAMSSITYHFGGKEGLYLAAADRIVALIGERQAPALAASREMIDGDGDPVAGLLQLMDSLALMMLSEQSASWARFIIREQIEPTEAFERIWGGMMRHVAGALIALVGRARPDLAERERRALVVLLVGQAVIMRAGRASACRILEVDHLGPAETELLRARLRANVRHMLEAKS